MMRQRPAVLAGLFVIFIVATAYAVYQGGSLAWHLWGTVATAWILITVSPLAPLSAIGVRRTVNPGPYHVGDSVTVTVELDLPRFWRWPWLEILDVVPEGMRTASHLLLLPGWRQRHYRWQYTVFLPQRGQFAFYPIRVRTGDFWGILTKSIMIDRPLTLVVWPLTVSLPKRPVEVHAFGHLNISRQRTASYDPVVQRLREYVAGDPLSHVHWKLSAHAGTFRVREFAVAPHPPLTIVLDYADQFGPDEWELALSVAASFLEHALVHRRPIGLVSLDSPEQAWPPSPKPAVIRQALDWLAELPAADGPKACPQPARLPPGCLLLSPRAAHLLSAMVIPLARREGALHRLTDLPAWLLQRTSRHLEGMP